MTRTDEGQLAKSVGKTIARHRQAKNLTQEEVAEKLGIGNEAVSRIERGTVMPTVARLIELAEVFGCKTSDLLTEVSNRASDQANYLNTRLSQLKEADRKFVIEIVDKLTARLGSK